MRSLERKCSPEYDHDLRLLTRHVHFSGVIRKRVPAKSPADLLKFKYFILIKIGTEYYADKSAQELIVCAK